MALKFLGIVQPGAPLREISAGDVAERATIPIRRRET
jgi:hypothetical protein